MARLENLLGAHALALADRLWAAAETPTAAAGAELSGPATSNSATSGSEAAALVTLLAHRGPPVGWLGEVVGLTSSGVTRLVDRLSRAGWLERAPASDARSRRLVLTPAGRQRAEEVLASRRAVLSGAVALLSATERVTLEALLDKVVSGLAEERLPALRVCRLCDRAACRSAEAECPLQHTVRDA